ncbi:MAG: hypothetical protein QGG40_11560, partial [Myxococcota bacterium]|nr:hypothetical protein [Myxococcota bacterium]
DLRAGLRVGTNLIQPTMRPGADNAIRSLDVEVFLGRRQHQLFGVGNGFNLSATRAGVGLVARL